MSQIDIENINDKKICLKNSFCIYNLTDTCNKCIVKHGNIRYKNLFKSGNTEQIDEVLKRIYN